MRYFNTYVSYLSSNSCKEAIQKVLNKTSKGHLLQVKRALIASLLMVFKKSICEKFGQKGFFRSLD